MTSSIINFIIEKYLANFLEINPEKTKTSLWSGTVELSNLKFKDSIFKTFNLPYLELVDGHIGSLKITMSLPRFYLYPIKVEVDNVFFFARQKNINDLSKEEEIQLMESYKKRQLKNNEELKQEVDSLTDESPSIIDQIVDNLNIEIRNIVFRFDDTMSYPRFPFCFGILLENIFIKSVASEKAVEGIKEKVFNVSNFSLFLDNFKSSDELAYTSKINSEIEKKTDPMLKEYLGNTFPFYLYCLTELETYLQKDNNSTHFFLLYRLYFSANLSINKKQEVNHLPILSLYIKLPKIDMRPNLLQIKTIMKEVNYIKLKSLYQNGLEKEYYNKYLLENEQKDYINTYIEYYKTKYLSCYKNEEANKEYQKKMEEIETGLRFGIIQSMRDCANKQLEYLTSINGIDEQIKSLNGTWFILSSNREEQISILNQEKERLMNKQKNAKHHSVNEYMANLFSQKNNDKEKKIEDDHLLYDFSFVIEEFTLDLKSKNRGPLLEFTFNKVNTTIKLTTYTQTFFFSLFSLSLTQFLSKNPLYSNLIFTKEEDTESQNLFIMEYKISPFLPKSNQKATIKTEKELFIILNIYTIKYITYLVQNALAAFNVEELGSYAKGEIGKYVKDGYSNVFLTGHYQHFNIDLDIDIKSPKVIFPQNFLDENDTNVLYASFGTLKVTSNLSEKKKKDVDYITLNDKEKMFDKYNVRTRGISVRLIKDFSFEEIDTKAMKLVDDIDISVDIENIIENKNLHFANFYIDLQISDIKINLKEEYVVFLIKVNNNIGIETLKMTEIKKKIERRKAKRVAFSHLQKSSFFKNKGQKTMTKNKMNNQIMQSLKNSAKEANNKANINTLLKKYQKNEPKESKDLVTLISVEIKSINIDIYKKKEFITFSLSKFGVQVKIDSNGDIELSALMKSITLSQNKSNYIEFESEKEAIEFNLKISHYVNQTDLRANFASAKFIFSLKFIGDMYSLLLSYKNAIDQGQQKLYVEKRTNETKEVMKKVCIMSVKGFSKKAKTRKELLNLLTNKPKIIEDDEKKTEYRKFYKEQSAKGMNCDFFFETISFGIRNEKNQDVCICFSMRYQSETKQNALFFYDDQNKREIMGIDYKFLDSKSTLNLNNITISICDGAILKGIQLVIDNKSALDLPNESKISKTSIIQKEKNVSVKINFMQINVLSSLYTDYTALNLSSSKQQPQQYAQIHNENPIFEVPNNISSFNTKSESSIEIPAITFGISDKFENRIVYFILLSLKEMKLKTKANSDTKNGTNFANALIEMISAKRFISSEVYIKEDLFYYADIHCEIRCDYFNTFIKAKENLIEPFKLQCEIIQVIKRMRQRIEISCDKVITFNISNNFKQMCDVMLMIYTKRKKDNFKYENEDEVVFINNTGVEIEIWFDEDSERKFICGEREIRTKEAKFGSTVSFKGQCDEFSFVGKFFYYRANNVKRYNITKSNTVITVEAKMNKKLQKVVTFYPPSFIVNKTMINDLILQFGGNQLPLGNNMKKYIPLKWILSGKGELFLRYSIEEIDLCLKESTHKLVTVNDMVLNLEYNYNPEKRNGFIYITPPIVITNYLPVKLKCPDSSGENQIELYSSIKEGNYFKVFKKKSLSIYDPSVNQYHQVTDTTEIALKEYLVFSNKEKIKLNKIINEEKPYTSFFTLTADIIIKNNTQCDLIMQLGENELNLKPKSRAFSYNLSSLARIKSSQNRAEYSQPFPIQISNPIFLKIRYQNKIAPLSITITKSAQYQSEFFIEIFHRFIIYNDLPSTISLIENERENCLVESKKVVPVYFINENENNSEFKIENNNSISNSFPINILNSFDLFFTVPQKTKASFSYDDVNYFEISRCAIKLSSHNNTIIIAISSSQFPLYQIENDTEFPISLIKEDKKVTINKKRKVPIIDDKNKNELTISLKGVTKNISFDEISEDSLVIGETEKYSVRVLPKNSNCTKTVTIKKISEMGEYYSNAMIKMLKKQRGMAIRLNLKGIVVSLIDIGPKEVFCFSMYKIIVDYVVNENEEIFERRKKKIENITASVMNIQLDLCVKSAGLVSVMIPKKQYINEIIDQIEDSSYEEKIVVPFIQLSINRKTEWFDDECNVDFPLIDIVVQEFNVNIDNCVLSTILTFYSNLFNQTKDDDSIVSFANVPMNDIENEIRQIVISQSSSNMLFIRLLSFAAIKFSLSIKINLQKLNISFLPNTVSSVLSLFTSISDANLSFNALLLQDVLGPPSSISKSLTVHYTSQCFSQLGKMIMNVDLIGSPLNLLDNISTGIIELIDEPRKGLIRGNSIKDVGKGFKRGISSFISNTLGGGLKGVSKITGSLLTATKMMTNEDNEEINPHNVVDGAVEGFKRGMSDMKEGVTGLFEKPLQGAKDEGVIGFFKGVGNGIVSAVLCPVSAVLNVGHGVIKGAANMTQINEGAKGRFRPIREFRLDQPIEENGKIRRVNCEIIEGEEIEIDLENKRLGLDDSKEIGFWGKFKDENNVEYLVIVTDIIVTVLERGERDIIKISLKKVFTCEMQRKKGVATVVFIMHNGEIRKISMKTVDIAVKVRNAVKKVVTPLNRLYI